MSGAEALAAALPAQGLMLMGGLHEDGGTIVLIGCGPGFWPVFTASPEYRDAAPDPVDRWSLRVLGDLARSFDATAVFPFGGPPYAPFIRWALAGGQCRSSPVGMLVHGVAGLMISFRGALVLAGEQALPVPMPAPCDGCAAPCATACPVGALRPGMPYDVAGCRAHIASPAGRDCLMQGCLARRACPVSQSFPRDPAQSALHMAAFLKG